MNINKPKVVFIGGIETGKTTTIQLLWEDEAVSLNEHDGCIEIGVREMIPGREFVDYDVVELPRIHYTSGRSWYQNNVLVINTISSADVIVIAVPLNDVSVMSHKQYIRDMFEYATLKPDISIFVALTMSDKVLTPISANNYQPSKSERIVLTAITSMIKRKDMVFSVFEDFIIYDKTFSPPSIVPVSYL